jgi:iron complex transport system substrate-binding protein
MTQRSLLRSFLAPLAVALLASVAACSSSEDSSADTTAPAGGAEDGAFPVTIEHKFGTTEIPEMPQRVVSLGYTEQDAILLFDVDPVAVRYAFGPEDDVYFPWADELAGDSQPEILPRETVNAEQIATLRPDLIMAITAGLTEEEYDTLSELAPVVVQPAEFEDFGTPWQEQTLLTGKVFGQEARARDIVDEVQAQFDDVAAQHPELEGVEFALSGPAYEGQYPFHSSHDTRSRFFIDLGMVVPEELDEIAGDEFYGGLSRERADLLDRDVLLFQSGSPAERAGLEEDPVLSALPVVEEGRSMFIEGSDYDALQFMSALSLPYLLEQLVPKLSELVS